MRLIHVRYLRGTEVAQRYPNCDVLDEDEHPFHEFVQHTVNAWEKHAPEDCDGRPGLRGEVS